MTGADGGEVPPRVTLRRVTSHDSDLILAWANDPVTRASSFHPEPIAPADHARWFAARLADPATAFWIGEHDGRPIGQVRLERTDDDSAEVSIAVAPDARGRGLGRGLLSAAIDEARVRSSPAIVLARVRTDNPASLALFGGAGFLERRRATCAGLPCVEFELRLI